MYTKYVNLSPNVLQKAKVFGEPLTPIYIIDGISGTWENLIQQMWQIITTRVPLLTEISCQLFANIIKFDMWANYGYPLCT